MLDLLHVLDRQNYPEFQLSKNPCSGALQALLPAAAFEKEATAGLGLRCCNKATKGVRRVNHPLASRASFAPQIATMFASPSS